MKRLLRRAPWIFLVPLVASLGLVCVWSISSPSGSSPDEPFHLWSIWCANGTTTSDCKLGDQPGTLSAPAEITVAACHAHSPEKSGSCTRTAPEGSSALAPFPAALSNVATGAYPNTYYEIAGILATRDVHKSVIVIRLINGFLCVCLVFSVIALSERPVRLAVALSWLVGVIPLGLFIIPSVNPSSWAVTGAGLSWAAALSAANTSDGVRRASLSAIAVLCVLLAFAARTDAAVFALAGIGIGLFLSPGIRRQIRARWKWALALAAIVSGSALLALASAGQWTLMTRPFRQVSSDMALLFSNTAELPGLWSGSFGSWGLGQLDTGMPAIVSVFATSAAAALAFWGLGEMWRAKAISLIVLVVMLTLIPLAILQAEAQPVGQWVQPRYLLPLLIIFLGVAMVGRRGDGRLLSRAQSAVLVVITTAAAGFALHRLLRRYVTGIDVSTPNLNSAVEWWHDGAPSPMVVWVLGTILFAVIAVSTGLFASRLAPPAHG